jgi:hypothetical protein
MQLFSCELLLTASTVPSSLILLLLTEVIPSSQSSILTTTTWCHIQEDGILFNWSTSTRGRWMGPGAWNAVLCEYTCGKSLVWVHMWQEPKDGLQTAVYVSINQAWQQWKEVLLLNGILYLFWHIPCLSSVSLTLSSLDERWSCDVGSEDHGAPAA